jgi:DNA-binding transcriptional ArsR family regulator
MGTDYATVARLLASPTRSAVVDALMEGRPLAAGELARLAGVRASTISEHLGELANGGLLTVVSAGRHRYYQLASAEVANALEALSRICPVTPARSLRQSRADRSLLMARLCYDHLAGGLGVAMLDKMRSYGWLVGGTSSSSEPDLALTQLGVKAFRHLGIDIDACRRTRRNFARSCLDWSERRAHLAGALGAAMTTALLEGKWLRRTGTGRGVQITDKGEHGLRTLFKISVADLDASRRGQLGD